MAEKKPEIADELIGSMPKTEETMDVQDSAGTQFDAAFYESESDGKPRLKKDGTFRKKRGGGASGRSTIAQIETPQEDLSYAACGSSTAEIIFIMGQALGGAEWGPSVDERRYMTDAWTQYYKAKEVKDLPPGLIVCTAMVSYAVPRFSAPETKSRAKRAWHWIKMRCSRQYREAHESHTNSRDD